MEEKKLSMDEVKKIVGNQSMLMKFGKEEYMKSFQKGEIYMNNLDYYINLEKESNDEYIGDKFEASLVLKNINFKLYEVGSDKLIAQGIGKNSETNFISKKYPIICLFCLDSSNITDNNFFPNKNLLQVSYKFHDEQIEQLKKFGDSVVIITDPKAFIDKIKEATHDIEVIDKKIKYYKENQKDYIEDVINEKKMVAFWKQEKYKRQNEYRIMICRETDEPLRLNIGDINNITKLLPSITVLGCYVTVDYNLVPIEE